MIGLTERRTLVGSWKQQLKASKKPFILGNVRISSFDSIEIIEPLENPRLI